MCERGWPTSSFLDLNSRLKSISLGNVRICVMGTKWSACNSLLGQVIVQLLAVSDDWVRCLSRMVLFHPAAHVCEGVVHTAVIISVSALRVVLVPGNAGKSRASKSQCKESARDKHPSDGLFLMVARALELSISVKRVVRK